ncbi:MAG: O-antigen ligase family protein, partial [Patescibacteria group bacterium]
MKKSIKGLVLSIWGKSILLNTIYLMLIPLFIYFNILNAASRPVALYSWFKFFEYVLLFMYIIKTKPSIYFLSTGLTVGILYSSIIAIGQFLLQHSLGGIFWFLGERTFTVDTPGIARFPLCLPSFFGCIEFLRSYATFPHPNVLAGYLAVGVPLLLNKQIAKYTNKQINKLNTVRKIAIVLGLLALVLTFSRSAVLVMILFGLFRFMQFFIFDKVKLVNTARPERSRREYRILNTAFMIHTSIFKKAAILFVFLLCVVGLYVLKNFNLAEESLVVRQELMASAWTLFQSSPLFGIGLGNFIVRLPDVLTAHSVYFLQPVHNIYLLLLSEIGIVGIGSLLLFGYIFLNTAISNIKNQKSNIQLKNKKSHHALRITLFVILVLGFVDHYWL